ncbi:MAG TPA: response regulator [Vicinamibacteria bacterium]|nr:response regulator [Vicinamibacteria bacterium]
MQQPKRPSGGRILVCEDDVDLQGLVGEVLWDAGHDVEFAANGEEAVARLGLGGVDLIVLNLGLPRLSGYGVLGAIGSLAQSPRVVTVTGNSDYATFSRAMREGAHAHLVKPFRLGELVATCERLLQGPTPARLDRRSERRHAVSGSVRVFDLAGSALGRGMLVDLSPGGAQIQLGAALNTQAGVRLAVDGVTGPALDVEGRVAWRGLAPAGFSHGLGFVNMTARAEEQVWSLLRVS